jgi:hypothetical protein
MRGKTMARMRKNCTASTCVDAKTNSRISTANISMSNMIDCLLCGSILINHQV